MYQSISPLKFRYHHDGHDLWYLEYFGKPVGAVIRVRQHRDHLTDTIVPEAFEVVIHHVWWKGCDPAESGHCARSFSTYTLAKQFLFDNAALSDRMLKKHGKSSHRDYIEQFHVELGPIGP